MLRKLLPLFTLALLLSQCRWKTNDPQPAAPVLPPITQNGSHTIGFLVDGRVWLPAGSFNFPARQAYYGQRTFWFTANQVTRDSKEQFGIYINPLPLNN